MGPGQASLKRQPLKGTGKGEVKNSDYRLRLQRQGGSTQQLKDIAESYQGRKKGYF